MLAGPGPRSVATGRRVQPRGRGPREREPPHGRGSRAARRVVAWPRVNNTNKSKSSSSSRPKQRMS